MAKLKLNSTRYIKQIRPILDVRSELARTISLNAESKFASGEFTATIKDIKRIPENTLESDIAVLFLEACFRLRRFEEADSALHEFIIKRVVDPEKIYKSLGVTLKGIYQTVNTPKNEIYAVRSKECFEQHLKLSPGDVEATWLLGNMLVNLKDFSKGEEVLNKAFLSDTANILIKLDLAECSIFVGKYSRVRTLLNNSALRQYKELSDKSYYLLMLYLRSVAGYCLLDLAAPSRRNENSDATNFLRFLSLKPKVSGWFFDAFDFWLAGKVFKKTDTKGHILDLTMKTKQLMAAG